MGERDRDVVEDSHLEELVDLAEENFAIPLEALESIRHVEGTRSRRARLELEWSEAGTRRHPVRRRDDTRQYQRDNPQEDIVAALEADSRLEHVDIEPDSSRWSLL